MIIYFNLKNFSFISLYIDSYIFTYIKKHSKELSLDVINPLTDIAVKEAELAVSGREVTPFILQRVFEITGGQSLKSSILLVIYRDLFCFFAL